MENNRRKNNRIYVNCPINLKVDSLITIEGKLKNISLKSIFIQINSRVAMQVHDELVFSFNCVIEDTQADISGTMCISRIAHGDGIAGYFTQMDEASTERLKQLIG